MRIVALGVVTQDVYLIDRDDLSKVEWNGQSIFSGLSFGAQVDIDKAEFHIGGGAANAAVSFARYGYETVFIGSIGKDVAGEAVIKCFDEENIDTSYIEHLERATNTNVLLLDAKTGERTELSFEGAGKVVKGLSARDLEDIAPDWLYISGVEDLHKVLEFVEKAKKLGVKVLWKPGKKELKQTKKVLGLLSDVDVLVVNKADAAGLVPGVILTELLARLSNYCKTVIITDGIMGAIATDHEETYRLGVYEQGKECDIAGTGDAFASGFLARFAESGDFVEGLKFASANASKVAQKYGGHTGALSGQETLHEMPIVKIDNLSEWLTPGKEKNGK